MNQNRALEFLYAAEISFPILHDRWGWKAKHFVELAITEVQELVDRLAELEGQHATPTALPQPEGDGRGVLVVEAQPMTPAFLTANSRAALPDNDGGL